MVGTETDDIEIGIPWQAFDEEDQRFLCLLNAGILHRPTSVQNEDEFSHRAMDVTFESFAGHGSLIGVIDAKTAKFRNERNHC